MRNRYDFDLTLFTAQGEPVDMIIEIDVTREEGDCEDFRYCPRFFYSYEIASIYNANIKGVPYSPTEEDSEDWQIEINHQASVYFNRLLDRGLLEAV